MIRLPNYYSKHVAVFGLGASGKAAYAMLEASGANVIAWADALPDASLNLLHYEQWNWDALDMLVLSPGVPLTHPQPHPVVLLAKQHGVRITCDVALLMEARPDACFIGITGTNGKSTSTALTAHCLCELGENVAMGGNIGVPALALEKADIYVLELSSYQLDLLDVAGLDVACLLNMSPDHLDRHGDMTGYIAAKSRIFISLKQGGISIIATDDAHTQQLAENYICQTVATTHHHASIVIDNDAVRDSGNIIALPDMPHLRGVHNRQNIGMVYAICRALGYGGAATVTAMQRFTGLAHRMEVLGRAGGRVFINDSKATNADAAAKSLATYRNIYWIAGGVAKEGGITELLQYANHITHAYFIGQSAEAFAGTAGNVIPHKICHTLDNAMQAALGDSKGQDNAVILLAPAAASFDQFANFEARGEAFKAMVAAL